MPGLDSMDRYAKALGSQPPPVFFIGDGSTVSANTFWSLWNRGRRQPGPPTAAPPTGSGEAPTRLTAGALPVPAAQAGKSMRLLEMSSLNTQQQGTLSLYDRLVHTSGISATVATLQTINTVALTRQTSGEDVEIWLEVYTTFGATNATITVNYTDQDGVARSFVTVSGFGASVAGRIVNLSGYQQHYGCRSIQSVQHSAGNTAGMWGITLARRLGTVYIPESARSANTKNGFDLGVPTVPDDACLALSWITSGTIVGAMYGDYCLGFVDNA